MKLQRFIIGILLATWAASASAQSYQEKQCMKKGWKHIELQVAGLKRQVLWNGPAGRWTKGAIVVMHGGSGHHFHFCVANAPIVEPQVRFSEMAIADGFGVFLLNSSDQVTDTEGRQCGKVWDDEVRNRPNLDLPYIGEVLRKVIPGVRPPGSRNEIFVTGLSSGGYMTVRASTHFDNLVTAFAPVSSGDPYGWHRICEKRMNSRKTVYGGGFDNETGKQIIDADACLSPGYSKEKPWDSAKPAVKPTFRVFHHKYDGIDDLTCNEKVRKNLRERGYPEAPAFLLTGDGRRSIGNHLWQDDYNQLLLEFFTSQLRQ